MSLQTKPFSFERFPSSHLLLGLPLTSRGKQLVIPHHKIKKGSIVSLDRLDLRTEEVCFGYQGVVNKVSKHSVEVVLYGYFQYIPVSLTGECQMMLKTLHQLKMLDSTSHSEALTLVLLVKVSPSPSKTFCPEEYKLFDERLNKYQKEAVWFALQSPQIALIHGPPGKTQTMVEIVRQLHSQGKSVLVTGPSNVSVDNLLERVSKFPEINIIRIGHPARIAESSLPYCLSTIVPRKGKKLAYYNKLVSEAIRRSDVVFSTLCGSGHNVLEDFRFDVTIIDEASQASEPDCWVALSKSTKAILGMSTQNTLSYSLFDRLLDTHGDNIKRMLQIQYRMNEKIMEFSSRSLYESKLIAHESVKDHLLCHLEHVSLTDDTKYPIVLFETEQIRNAREQRGDKIRDRSLYNHIEACVVISMIDNLMVVGVKKEDIGVITPYSAQVHHLITIMRDDLEGIEIGTVDGFQGREKEVIILSMVRANDRGEIGFLREKRRLNGKKGLLMRIACDLCFPYS
ncbi:AAA domain-containing protein [Blakeslea trispora]|nr:AAA domain-containing protein [Blakeslea trispora]